MASNLPPMHSGWRRSRRNLRKFGRPSRASPCSSQRCDIFATPCDRAVGAFSIAHSRQRPPSGAIAQPTDRSSKPSPRNSPGPSNGRRPKKSSSQNPANGASAKKSPPWRAPRESPLKFAPIATFCARTKNSQPTRILGSNCAWSISTEKCAQSPAS